MITAVRESKKSSGRKLDTLEDVGDRTKKGG